jgi:hypothetical protein
VATESSGEVGKGGVRIDTTDDVSKVDERDFSRLAELVEQGVDIDKAIQEAGHDD